MFTLTLSPSSSPSLRHQLHYPPSAARPLPTAVRSTRFGSRQRSFRAFDRFELRSSSSLFPSLFNRSTLTFSIFSLSQATIIIGIINYLVVPGREFTLSSLDASMHALSKLLIELARLASSPLS